MCGCMPMECFFIVHNKKCIKDCKQFNETREWVQQSTIEQNTNSRPSLVNRHIDARGGPPAMTDGVTFIGNMFPFWPSASLLLCSDGFGGAAMSSGEEWG